MHRAVLRMQSGFIRVKMLSCILSLLSLFSFVFVFFFLLKLTRMNLPNPFLFLKPILKFQRYLLK